MTFAIIKKKKNEKRIDRSFIRRPKLKERFPSKKQREPKLIKAEVKHRRTDLNNKNNVLDESKEDSTN